MEGIDTAASSLDVKAKNEIGALLVRAASLKTKLQHASDTTAVDRNRELLAVLEKVDGITRRFTPVPPPPQPRPCRAGDPLCEPVDSR